MSAQAVPQVVEHETTNLDCIHCGICLSVCPTYLQLGSEVDSPRGRIYLIEAEKEGRVSTASPTFQKHMSLCLECRACETACPSGVQFSVMMNGARSRIRETTRLALLDRLARRIAFRWLLPSPRLLRVCFRLLRLYQRSGLRRVVRALGILKILPRKVEQMEGLLPEVPLAPRYRLPSVAPQLGRSRVSLFEGCVMTELFGPVHEATVRVLDANDVTVCRPARQTCCGALHLHDGEMKLALDLARRNIDAFEKDGADFIVVNAAGCGAMLKEYGHLLKDDPQYAARAREFSRRVQDVHEFLDGIGLQPDLGTLNMKLTYDDPCHLLHGQGIKLAPRKLLNSIPGIEWIELRDGDRCCGSAGIYNITHPEMAARILEEKIANLARTGADAVASGNPGCMLQIRQGLRARNIPMKVLHPIELLDQAYRKPRS